MIAMAAMAATLTIAAQARANSINFFLTTPESGSPPRTPVEVIVTTGSLVLTFTPGGLGPFTAPQGIFTNPASANMAPVEINVRGAFQAESDDGLAPVNTCVGNSGASTTCAFKAKK